MIWIFFCFLWPLLEAEGAQPTLEFTDVIALDDKFRLFLLDFAGWVGDDASDLLNELLQEWQYEI